MATLADLSQRVKDYLYSAAPHEHPFVTLLNEALDDSETDVDLDTGIGASFTNGDELQIEDELMLVTAVSTDTLTVIRAWRNTTAATHADNTPIIKNPRFSNDEIANAITSSLLSLEDYGVHGWGTGSVTLVADQTYYDLTETDIQETFGVLDVYYAKDTTLLPASVPFRYLQQLHSTVSTTGHGLHLWYWGDQEATESLYFTYAKVLDGVADISTAQEELTVLGAVVILLGGTIGPATHDPGARTDRTVAPGQTSRDVRHFLGQFFIAARAEAANLAVMRAKASNAPWREQRAQRWRR